MKKQVAKLGDCSFQILTDGREFLGIGKVYIGRTLVRSGRLPLRFWHIAELMAGEGALE